MTAGAINHSLVTSEAALLTMRATRHISGLNDVLPTQVASAQQTGVLSRDPFLVSYYGTHNVSPVSDPLPTVTTVDRHALVSGEAIDVEDPYFRMLEPHELLVGTGFLLTYKLVGNKRDRVRLIGNSNYPGIEQLLVYRVVESLAP